MLNKLFSMFFLSCTIGFYSQNFKSCVYSLNQKSSSRNILCSKRCDNYPAINLYIQHVCGSFKETIKSNKKDLPQILLIISNFTTLNSPECAGTCIKARAVAVARTVRIYGLPVSEIEWIININE